MTTLRRVPTTQERMLKSEMTPEQIAEARARFKAMKKPRAKRAERQSKFKHVTWNARFGRWQVVLGVQGSMHCAHTCKPDDFAEEECANWADWARWWLQDFLPRQPKYNFPDQLPPLDEIPDKLRVIRNALLAAGCPQNAPHHPGFVPPEQVTRTNDCVISDQFPETLGTGGEDK